MFLVLACAVSAFVIPLIVGVMILGRARGNPIIRFAGWMTLKPVLATPLWFFFTSLMTSNLPPSLPRWLGWVPGVLLTLILIYIYRDIVFDEFDHPIVPRLLGLDVARWGSTAFMYGLLNNAEMPSSGISGAGACFIPIAIFMPTIFAIAAFSMVNNLDQVTDL